jgi:putative CocE/NonD family hydrolase
MNQHTHGQSNREDVTTQYNLSIPMRDGVELSADLWRPVALDRYPAILIRTPYTKTAEFLDTPNLGTYFASKGYVLLVQDVRGQGESDGEYQDVFQEGDDGYDSIEWIARQSWSNGRVGMMGLSYLGVVQWLAAGRRPPHLVCIVPSASPGFPFEDEPYRGGAFLLGVLPWLYGVVGNRQAREELNWDWIMRQRPLTRLDVLAGMDLPFYQDWLRHSTMDEYWKSVTLMPKDFRGITIPALTITGWFDDTLPGAMYYWREMATYSAVADQQFLIIGPWNHIQTFIGGEKTIHGLELSDDSVVDIRGVTLNFFERFLKANSSIASPPRASVYITGANCWLYMNEYPPKNVRSSHLYLHSQGNANTSAGDGSLSWMAPGDEPPDHYIYDPDNPAPSHMIDIPDYSNFGINQEALEQRQDILVYTTERLNSPLTILGPVSLVLYAATDARDTDFIARILDVYPDGRIIKPQAYDGVIRARYRKGYNKTELTTPNKVERYTIKLYDFGHSFLKGHRIRLNITSSSFPSFNPNTNTGNPVATDVDVKIAKQTILHNSEEASYLNLPIIPQPDAARPFSRSQ